MNGNERLLLGGITSVERFGETPVVILLDEDRVFFDTEKFYESGRTVFSAYPETYEALDKLKRLGRLCVFSEVTVNGTPDLQRKKLKEIGIAHLFEDEDIHIGGDKIQRLPQLIEKYRYALVVLFDDRVEVVEEFKRLGEKRGNDPEVFGVWILRGMHAQEALAHPRRFDVHAMAKDLNVAYDIVLQRIAQRVKVPVLRQDASSI